MPKDTQKVTKREAAPKTDEKKRRSKKDPSAPKRGLSAYMFFSQATRAKVKEENPEVSFGQIGKLLGEKWGKLSEAEKKPFLEMAEKDKKRYEDEKAAMK